MKNFKKIASAIAALSLAACVAVSMSATVFTASAATTVTVKTDKDTDGVTHTYTAYQIFKGTYTKTSDDGAEKEILTNVSWGKDIDETNLLADARFTALAGSDADINKIMEKLGKIASKTPNANELAQVIANHLDGSGTELDGKNQLDDGYYIIKDSFTDAEGKEDTYSYHILGVVGGGTPIQFETKKGKPSFQKKLKDTNDTDGTTTDWQDSADYDIGDIIPFQLKATLPSDIDKYKTYKMVFHDNLQNTFDTPTLGNVWIDVDGNKSYNDGDIKIDDASIEGTGTWTVTLADIIASAKGTALTSDMAVYVEYTAKLKDTAILGSAGNWNEAWLEYSNNPNYEGKGDAGDDEDTEETPHDRVVVFTYKTVINKVDQNSNALAGASFTLQKKNSEGTYDDVKTITYEEATGEDKNVFTFSGLDDGDYKLIETKTPDGYNSIDPIEFTITAEHDILSDNPSLTSLSGDATSGAVDGFEFSVETDKSGLSADVVNQSGATLPSTGGIGTTLFYLGGGALVAVAGVMLITKKRMTKE